MNVHPLKKVLLLLCFLLLLHPVSALSAPQFLDDEAEAHMNVSFSLVPARAGSFTLVFHYQDEKNYHALKCTPGKIVLQLISEGAQQTLATRDVTKWKTPAKITLQRRGWMLRVIVDEEVLLTAYHSAPNDGKIGALSSNGWSWSQARVQPVETELYFDDDFTRVPGHDGEWKNHSGTWELTSSSDEISASNQDMSANPFSYRVQAQSTPAFTHSGRPFWDNYRAQVSVRPEGQGRVGLAFYVRDPENYLLFSWSALETPDARQLIRVENGKRSVLARQSGASLPQQWYRMAVRTSPGTIEVLLDGEPVFEVSNDAFGQGGIGLYAEKTAANFDDVRVRSHPSFPLALSENSLGSWTSEGGAWQAKNGSLGSASITGDRGATRMLLTGEDAWNNYEMTVSGKAGEDGSCGVIVGFQDLGNYTVFRWAGEQSLLPFKGRAQLLRYENGHAKILSESPVPAPDPDGFAQIKLRFKSGAITVFHAGKIVAQTADETLQNGCVGLWVQGTAPVSFRDATVFLPLEPELPKVPPKMEGDALMVGWASPVGEWPLRRVPGGMEFWNTGEFFGDAQLDYEWQFDEIEGNALEWALRAESASFSSGYLLRAEGINQKLKLILSQGDSTLKSGEIDLQTLKDQPSLNIRIELEGKAVLVTVGKTPVLSYLPALSETVPGGTRVAVRGVEGFIASVKNLRALSANRDDYTFNEAPTDWYSLSGDWSIFSRWPCYSDWSFFGGKGQNPILWSKREYSGDIVLEMYVHPQMDLPKELGYSHPGDLNITLCGDGKTAASGYSFVLAGWSNTRSAILKNSTVVAQTRGENARFDRAFNQNSTFHRRWYYVRAEARRAVQDGKEGVRLRYFVDEKLLAEYFDEDPLETFESGRVAFWTVEGAMMMARAKIENQKPGARALPDDVLDFSPASTLAQEQQSENSEFLTPRALEQEGVSSALVEVLPEEKNPAFKISNRSGGGVFAVSLHRASGDDAWIIDENARFKADFSLSPNAKVDLYFTIDGKRHLVELNGEQRADARVEKLGIATLSAGVLTGAKTWRQVSFALGEELKKKYPEKNRWAIEKIEIGALHGDEYRWQGFSGNPFGASYSVRNGRLLLR